jgi:hypothetical protein
MSKLLWINMSAIQWSSFQMPVKFYNYHFILTFNCKQLGTVTHLKSTRLKRYFYPFILRCVLSNNPPMYPKYWNTYAALGTSKCRKILMLNLH